MSTGWIKIHRKMLECQSVTTDSDCFSTWMYLLLKATHKDCPATFGGEKIILHPGQLIIGRKMIAQHFKINESKVYRTLKRFESEQQIEIISNNKASLITIVNWGLYQLDDLEVNNKRTTNQTENEQQTNTIQEIKNKEIKEDIYIPSSEIVDYLNQKAGTRFKTSSDKTRKFIKARLNEGFTVDDFKKVIDIKVAEWSGDTYWCKFLRPETLFGTKFEGYLNQREVKKPGGNQFNSFENKQDYGDWDAFEAKILNGG